MTCKKAILILSIANILILSLGMTWSQWYGYKKCQLDNQKIEQVNKKLNKGLK